TWVQYKFYLTPPSGHPSPNIRRGEGGEVLVYWTQLKFAIYALPQGYPAMTQGNNLVYGYLFSFANNEVLISLDQLEDYHPQKPMSENLYNRKQLEVFDLENNSLGLAWVYLMTFEKICQLKGTPQIDGWWSGRIIHNY
ncbi:MAG: gamma-glutamylcyclotransferase, partial [Rivularia sp. (in: cyanobacteria)]